MLRARLIRRTDFGHLEDLDAVRVPPYFTMLFFLSKWEKKLMVRRVGVDIYSS